MFAPRFQRSRAGDVPVAARFGHIAFTAVPGPMPAPLYLRAADAKPQPGFQLRPAHMTFNRVDASAAPLFALMHGECFDNGWDASAFTSLIGAPGAMAIIAQNGEEPAGFVLARQAADEAEIITIGTRPFAQRQGLAKRMIEQLSASLQGTAATQLFLEVAATNTAARALYAAAGFHDAGTRKGYYDRGNGQRDDAIVMRKTLPS
jgi:ribosomal-protein-alanine N-acetyltransferase